MIIDRQTLTNNTDKCLGIYLYKYSFILDVLKYPTKSLSLDIEKFMHNYFADETKKLFQISLKTINSFGNNSNIIYAIIVDDEYMIRNAIKSLITNQLIKDNNIELVLIEANDGIECLLAIYLANMNQIKIEFVITDENMNYMNGSYASEIIKTIIKNGKFQDIPIFMSTAVGKNTNDYKPNIIKKVFSKPMDINSIRELLCICGLIK